MQTRCTEIADGVHQLTTLPEGSPIAYNQYLIEGDEPTLFHTGLRSIFHSVESAVATVLPPRSLRWVGFGHVEADECGSMNDWLALAPDATVFQSVVGCAVSLEDLADRPPRPLADGEELDVGGHVLRWIDTPHVPHGWEAGLVYDETTRTLFCGDLFTRYGEYTATSDDDLVAPAVEAEDMFPTLSLHPASAATLRRLAELDVATLAPMHAPAFRGDCRRALLQLADDVERRVADAR